MKILKKIRKNRYILIGVAGLCIIAVIAFVLPEQYFSYYDKRTEKEISYLQTDVNIYQVEYSTFADKLLALGKLYSSKAELNSVMIQNVYDDEYKTEILSAFENEFEIWERMGLIPYYLTYDTDELKSCGLYSIYAGGDDKNDIKAFNYWKLEFKNESGSTYTVALDAEFQKIYEIKISYPYIMDKTWAQEESGKNNSSTSIAYYAETTYMWNESLLSYFELGNDFFVYYYEDDEIDAGYLKAGICNDTDPDFKLPIGTKNSETNIYMGICPEDNFLQI